MTNRQFSFPIRCVTTLPFPRLKSKNNRHSSALGITRRLRFRGMLHYDGCSYDSRGKDAAIAAPRADVALAVAAAAVLGIGVGFLLGDIVAGLAAGAGSAVVFRFALRMINTRR